MKESWIIENKLTGKQIVYLDYIEFRLGCKVLIRKGFDKMFLVKLMEGSKLIDSSELKDYFNE